MCARRIDDWGRVKHDCEKALEHDKYNTKAGYLLGLFHCNICEFRQAIHFFEQAVEMSSRQNKPKSFTMEVSHSLDFCTPSGASLTARYYRRYIAKLHC
jgi:hypothetical protein